MLLIGAPVNFLAGVITGITKYTHVANFLIHLVPAILIGLFMFSWSWPDLLPFVGMFAVSASVFFVVDEIIYHKVNLKSHKVKLLFTIPLIAYFTFMGPTYINTLENKITSAQIDKKGPPVVKATINGQEVGIRSTYCWTSDGDGCAYDKEPYLIPPGRGIEGLEDIHFTEPPSPISFDFKKSVGEPEFYAYYFQDGEKKEVKIQNSTLELPEGIPNQLVRLLAKWDNHERVWFYIGVFTEE
ncbi:hypothetical protein HF072_06050 [Bacillus sp. RO3]|nr:hypothetical protein [Bacillus sp. RO3]